MPWCIHRDKEARRAAEWRPGHLGIELEHESKQKKEAFVCTGSSPMYRCKALFLSGIGHLCPSHILGNAEPCCDAFRPHVLLFTHSIQ